MLHKKIVVCGATGNQGGAVAAALLNTGKWSVTGVTRDPGSAAALKLAGQGAEIVKADPLDKSSMVRAFEGAYGVFCLTQPWSYELGKFDIDAEIRQGKNMIWAGMEAGVKRVIYSSVINFTGDPSGVSWIDSKLLLEELFNSYLPGSIIVRPALYMENVGSALLKIDGSRIIGRFSAEAMIPYIALKDIGNAVAMIFGSPEDFEGGKVILAGDLISGKELASFLAAAYPETPYRYEAVKELCLRICRPRSFFMRKFFEKQGKLLHKDSSPADAYHLMPHDPVSMEEYLRSGALCASDNETLLT